MSENFGPRPGGGHSSLEISDSTVVKASPGTLFALNVTTAGTTVGYASDSPAVPASPVLGSVAGGTIAETTYYARIAYTDADGAVFGTLSSEASEDVLVNHLLTVASPAASPGATGWIPYVGTSAGTGQAQVVTPIAIGTAWTEPTTGLISAVAVPGSDSTHLLPPAAPTLSSVVSGALGATTYYAKTTYLNALGQTLGSAESNHAVAANSVLKVTSPAAYANAAHYNVFVAVSTGAETLQNVSPILIGTDWQQPDSGLISGSALPVADTTHLLPPAAPTLSNVPADEGITGETYFAKVTYLNPLGQTIASAESSLAADGLLKVASPAAYANADHYNIFASTESGSEVKQNATPIALGTDWTEPESGLISEGAVIDAAQICVIPNTVGITELVWPCFAGITIVPGTGQVISVSFQ